MSNIVKRRTFLLSSIAALPLVACGDSEAPDVDPTTPRPDDEPPASNGSEEAKGDDGQKFPDVLEVELTPSGEEWMIAVTISSPYDTPERYADGWRVMTPDGEVLAEHDLAHDHANEQPFTRQRGPFAIPAEVEEVVVEGRDKANGYGGKTIKVPVPR